MGRYLRLGSLLALLTLGCALPAAAAENGARERTAVPAVAAESDEEGRRNVLPPTAAHSFGEVSLLDTTRVEHTFVFKNTGAEAVKIRSLRGSCGCVSTVIGDAGRSTAAGTPLPTLAPGEETRIRMTLDLTPLSPGPVRKGVSVYVEGSTSPVAQFGMVGTLRPSVEFSPNLIELGRLDAEDAPPVSLTVTLDPRVLKAGSLPPLVSSNGALKVTPVPGKTGSERGRDGKVVRRYTLSVAPDAPLGLVHGTLSFRSDEDGGARSDSNAAIALRSRSATFSGQIVGPLSALPHLVSFGIATQGQASVRRIGLRALDPELLKGLKVETGAPWLSARLSEVSAEAGQPPTRVLEVSLGPNAPFGVLRQQVTVVPATGRRLVVPVSVLVRPAPKRE
jgi:hypothetical protein